MPIRIVWRSDPALCLRNRFVMLRFSSPVSTGTSSFARLTIGVADRFNADLAILLAADTPNSFSAFSISRVPETVIVTLPGIRASPPSCGQNSPDPRDADRRYRPCRQLAQRYAGACGSVA